MQLKKHGSIINQWTTLNVLVEKLTYNHICYTESSTAQNVSQKHHLYSGMTGMWRQLNCLLGICLVIEESEKASSCQELNPRTPLACWCMLSGCEVCDWGIRYHLCSTYRGLWGLLVVRLLWLSGRALAAQARGVLGSTPSSCWPLYFRLITSKFLYFQHEARCSEHSSTLSTRYSSTLSAKLFCSPVA